MNKIIPTLIGRLPGAIARQILPVLTLATGKVTSVKVLKSTGAKILDDSAAVTFMQWRAKPHLIDHAILPANFVGAHGDNKSIKW
jgi:TonB family protein